MLCQITEAVQIENTPADTLMNDRAEWNMTRVPRVTISMYKPWGNVVGEGKEPLSKVEPKGRLDMGVIPYGVQTSF